MKAIFFKAGRPILAETAEPAATPGRVLVETHYSAVSPGTEGSLLTSSGRSFLSLALEKRHRADRLWQAVQRRDLEDIRTRIQRLAGRRAQWSAPGYSLAGIVRAVGQGVTAFSPGDRVAVAGAGYAIHAERIVAPRNLVVRVPENVPLEAASLVALGAIALQSVRRAESRIGETTLVLGLGLLGQLTARILLASGCRVLGWDPREERRVLAAAHGLEPISAGSTAEVPEAVLSLTEGRGADQVIIAAAGGREVVEAGARSARRSGTLVLLGNTPVEVEREAAYERELDLRMSTSYGPGRYDPRYEEEGADYPFSHVRWAENRNMSAWLGLLASGRVRVDDLLTCVRDLEGAATAYVELRQSAQAPLGLVFRYPPVVSGMSGKPAAASAPMARPTLASPLRVAVLGTGSYAAEGILPALVGQGGKAKCELLAGTVPARRETLARRFGFARVGSDYGAAAADPGVDLVVIVTRHHLHADLTIQALSADHPVFCEKPLVLTPEEADRIETALSETGRFLVVGFNRRFAPAVECLRRELRGRHGPLQISYRVQAGMLPEGHWIRGPEGGGRLIGEGVHMVDLVRFLAASPLERAWALPGGAGAEGDPAADNFHLGLRYEDGSTATILYTSRGAPDHPKERIECHWDGRSLELTNFTELRETGRKQALWSAPRPQKGQNELWRATLDALLMGQPSPTPAAEVIETSRAVLALEQSRRGA